MRKHIFIRKKTTRESGQEAERNPNQEALNRKCRTVDAWKEKLPKWILKKGEQQRSAYLGDKKDAGRLGAE